MKRTLVVFSCLALLILVVNLSTIKNNANIAVVGCQEVATQTANQIAKNNTAELSAFTATHAQLNSKAFRGAAENRTRGATTFILNKVNALVTDVAQSNFVRMALLSESVIVSGYAQTAVKIDNQPAVAQAGVISGEGDYDVILPNQVVVSTDATSQQFSGKEEANAVHLAAGPATLIAQSAHGQTIVTTGAAMVT